MVIDWGSTVSNASSSSHIHNGYTVNKFNSINSFTFPIGDGNNYRPITLTSSSADNNIVSAAYMFATQNQSSLNSSLSSIETYAWDVQRITGTGGFNITIPFDASYNISDIFNLTIVMWDGTEWIEILSTYSGTSSNGSITTNSPISDFSNRYFTLGYKASNPGHYWVGGSGDWNDLSHWVTSSGGSINPTNIPTANDNVYFDVNSFSSSGQTVSISNGAADCKTIDWTGVTNDPTFDISDDLNVYGSLIFVTNMTLSASGSSNINLKSTSSGNSVTLGGNALNAGLIFDGVGGEWDLLDSISLTNYYRYFSVSNGTLRTNGNGISCGQFSVQNNSTVDLSSSNITLYGYSCNVSSTNFDAGTSTILLANSGGTFPGEFNSDNDFTI